MTVNISALEEHVPPKRNRSRRLRKKMRVGEFAQVLYIMKMNIDMDTEEALDHLCLAVDNYHSPEDFVFGSASEILTGEHKHTELCFMLLRDEQSTESSRLIIASNEYAQVHNLLIEQNETFKTPLVVNITFGDATYMVEE